MKRKNGGWKELWVERNYWCVIRSSLKILFVFIKISFFLFEFVMGWYLSSEIGEDLNFLDAIVGPNLGGHFYDRWEKKGIPKKEKEKKNLKKKGITRSWWAPPSDLWQRRQFRFSELLWGAVYFKCAHPILFLSLICVSHPNFFILDYWFWMNII